MKNIERFKLCTAYIFAELYEEFPVARGIEARSVVAALKLPTLKGAESDPTNENNFVAHTLQWLVDTGYLIMRESGSSVRRYVLAPKALEALNASERQLVGEKPTKDEKSVGEQLVEASKDLAKDVGKEAKRQFVTKLIGEIFGYGIRAMMSG